MAPPPSCEPAIRDLLVGDEFGIGLLKTGNVVANGLAVPCPRAPNSLARSQAEFAAVFVTRPQVSWCFFSRVRVSCLFYGDWPSTSLVEQNLGSPQSSKAAQPRQMPALDARPAGGPAAWRATSLPGHASQPAQGGVAQPVAQELSRPALEFAECLL